MRLWAVLAVAALGGCVDTYPYAGSLLTLHLSRPTQVGPAPPFQEAQDRAVTWCGQRGLAPRFALRSDGPDDITLRYVCVERL